MWACPQAIGYVQIEKDRLMYKIQIKATCASLNCWEKRFVCETGVKDIFKDPCDCGGSAWNKYMSGQGEERDCVFAEQNVDFSFFWLFYNFHLYFLVRGVWKLPKAQLLYLLHRWGKSEILGVKGMVVEEEGMLFVRSLVEGQMLRFMRAGIVVCVVLVVVVVVLLVTSFSASYWGNIS